MLKKTELLAFYDKMNKLKIGFCLLYVKKGLHAVLQFCIEFYRNAKVPNENFSFFSPKSKYRFVYTLYIFDASDL